MILYSHFSASKTSDPLPRLLSAPSQHWGLCGWSGTAGRALLGLSRVSGCSTGLLEGRSTSWTTPTWPTSQVVHGYSLPSAGREHLGPRGGDCRGGRGGLQEDGRTAEALRPGRSSAQETSFPATAHCLGRLGQFARRPLGPRQSLQRRAERTAVEGHPPRPPVPQTQELQVNSSGTLHPPGASGVITWGLQL